jgi:tetratricopeptide (TPR) repeat protein
MKQSRRMDALILILLAPFLCCAAAAADEPAHPQTIPGLGTATFSTSTHSPEAQTDFMRGLLLLHVFEYDDAAKAFQSAQKIDPTFVMAFWGEAMTHNHPVWNELDVAAGQAALNKLAPTPEARAALTPDPRQRAFLAAVEILYDGKGTKPERDARYADAMEKLAKAYPSDDEAQLFYSLALLGRSESVRDVPVYLQAAAIAKAAYERNPNHPGAAHYWIHGMDDPDHAAGALVAARTLSKIAPDAGHAQHMCSHIFMALGMWQAVVDANLQAMRVVDDHSRALGRPTLDCGHYAIWLLYAYEQQGRHHQADDLLEACRTTGKDYLAWIDAHPGQPSSSPQARQRLIDRTNTSLVTMRGTAVIESPLSKSAVSLIINTASLSPDVAFIAGWNDFTTGYAAVHQGDLPTAQNALKDLRQVSLAYHARANREQETATYLDILADDLSGLISSKSGDMSTAIAQVRRAAATYDRMAFDFGPPPILKPPQELLGELLFRDGKPAQAGEAFKASLRRAPNRSLSLLGLARAQDADGEKTAAATTYKQLVASWKTADPGDPDLAEAQHYIAATGEKRASR